MYKKGEGNLVIVMVGVIVAIILFSVIASVVSTSTSYERITDTSSETIPVVVPFNITLTGNNPQTLVNVTNGTITLLSGNYTDYLSENKLEVLVNDTWLGSISVIYDDQHAGFLTGMTGIIVGFVPILALVVIILYLVARK